MEEDSSDQHHWTLVSICSVLCLELALLFVALFLKFNLSILNLAKKNCEQNQKSINNQISNNIRLIESF